MATILIGYLGSVRDAGFGPKRKSRWRPTVAACMQPDLPIDRLELLVTNCTPEQVAIVVADIAEVSPQTEIHTHDLTLTNAWDFEEVFAVMYDWTRRYSFDTEKHRYLYHMTTGSHVSQICGFLLAEARHLPAQLLQTSPGDRKSGDVVGSASIIDLDLSRYDQLAARFELERQADLDHLKSGIATRNRAFNELMARIERVALNSQAPVLLTGPTGAGKSALARRIHALKARRAHLAGRFVEVNCATLRGDTAMSTLFGHVKGVFTGAVTARPGLLCAADGGLLFLDEVGELGVDEQAMLLRAIEEGRFMPVGADTEVTSRFQLICGTNRDLQADVATGRFRADLLARIDLWTFQLPGLAQRREDIEPNLAYELDLFARTAGHRVSFNRESRRAFLDFATRADSAWAGNFRDLNAAITRMATLAEGGRITLAEVDDEIARLRAAWGSAGTPREQDDETVLASVLDAEALAALDRFDRVQLADVIRVCRASRSQSDAGRTLFAVSREKRRTANDADRIRKYLARYDLDWGSVAD